MEKPFNIKVNGKMLKIKSLPSTPLLWILRDELKLTGTKFSCGQGLCGACTIHIDQKAYRSCIFPISALKDDQEVKTIEGLSAKSPDHPVLKAWKGIHVPQCGYCQPGQIMKASAMYDEDPSLSSEKAIKSMDILCRCGSYPRIKQALKQVFDTKDQA